MYLISSLLFLLAGLTHVLFFVAESVLFQKEKGYKYFKMLEKDHQAAKIWALNQGFYNLFFALGIFAGLVMAQKILLIFCASSMVCAGLVLGFSSPRLRRGAVVQALPPLLGLVFLFLPQT